MFKLVVFLKGKKSPIGTITGNYKKVAEGKWVKIKKQPSLNTKKEESKKAWTLYSTKLDAIAKENGVEHDLSVLKKVYQRRPPGKGVNLDIASRADFDKLYKNTSFAMISAGRNPMNAEDMKMSDAQIEQRTTDLSNDLVKAGYVYTPGDGKYTNPEESFMVMVHDADREHMFSLGTKYHQDSVAFNVHGKNSLLMTTGDKKGDVDMAGDGFSVIDKPAKDDDFYTDILVGGKKMRFSLLMDEVKKALRLIFNLRKGKYTKRWKGKDGKWRYEYYRAKDSDPSFSDYKGHAPIKTIKTVSYGTFKVYKSLRKNKKLDIVSVREKRYMSTVSNIEEANKYIKDAGTHRDWSTKGYYT